MNENEVTKNNNKEHEDGIDVSPVNVHMFDFGLKDILSKLMTSNVICGAGTFVSLLLAFAFGVMFLIGGVGLVKGKHSAKNGAESAVVEASHEESAEISGDDAEEDGHTEAEEE